MGQIDDVVYAQPKFGQHADLVFADGHLRVGLYVAQCRKVSFCRAVQVGPFVFRKVLAFFFIEQHLWQKNILNITIN